MQVRLATPADAGAIARIYNDALGEQLPNLEAARCTPEDVLGWFDGAHPVVVAEEDGAIAAFARSYGYRAGDAYRGVFEMLVFTDRERRRRGAGLATVRELVTQARAAGAWKLLARVFVENASCRALLAALGFREVGVYYRHGKLEGRWRDVVTLEKFLAPLGAETSAGAPAPRPPREQILELMRSAAADKLTHALESARAHLEVYRRRDPELLAAGAHAFFASRAHDAATRGRFVEVFRAYASIAPEAAREVADALFAGLDRLSIGLDIDVFYETAFVVRQVVGASRALAPHLPRLLEWVKLAVDLPPGQKGRISPANLTSLLIALAVAACESEAQKQQVVDLAAEAKARHRVEPPSSIRPPSVPPPAAPAPQTPSKPPPLPPSAKKKKPASPKKAKGTRAKKKKE